MDTIKPTLGYWKIRGLAAQIRYILHYANVDFTDCQYEQGDAPDFSRESWFSVKSTLGLDFPNLPYWIDSDVKLTETSAITKYVCKKYCPELLPQTDAELGAVEMCGNIVNELKWAAVMPQYQQEDRAVAYNAAKPKLD